MRNKGPHDRVNILVGEDAEHEVHWPSLGQEIGERRRGGRIMGAVDPGWNATGERAVGELLETRRPTRATDGLDECRSWDGQAVLDLEHLQGEARVAALMRTGKVRLKVGVNAPITPFEEQRRTAFGRNAGDRAFRFGGLGEADD